MRGGGQHGRRRAEEERRARARACMFGDTSLHSRGEQPHTDPEQQGRGAGGETACYLAVVAVIAVDCLFDDELTTPLSTKAKLCIHRYMNLYTLMCALWILCICICVYILYIDQSLIIYILHGQVN